MKIKLLAAAAALAVAAPALAVTNLVTNGSFATGDFTGWTQIGNTGFTGVGFGSVVGGDATNTAHFGPVGSTGGIEQTIATAPGHSYTLSFDLSNSGGIYNSEEVSFGGVDAVNAVNQPGFAGMPFTYTVHATSGSSVLAFAFRQDPSYYYLTNISLTSNTPEPAMWALMIGGFGLVGTALRRRGAALAA